jgi:hypothetical protein
MNTAEEEVEAPEGGYQSHNANVGPGPAIPQAIVQNATVAAWREKNSHANHGIILRVIGRQRARLSHGIDCGLEARVLPLHWAMTGFGLVGGRRV